MAGQVVRTERAEPSTRLRLHPDAYRLCLIELVQPDYETLHTLLGDEAFDALTGDYIDQHPSSHPNIRWFGKHMPDHLEQQAPYCGYPVLGETARFEWALQTAFDATDTELLDTEAVTQIPPQAWPEMCPVFHDLVQRLRFAWKSPTGWSPRFGRANPHFGRKTLHFPSLRPLKVRGHLCPGRETQRTNVSLARTPTGHEI
jgi:hypothetical protein